MSLVTLKAEAQSEPISVMKAIGVLPRCELRKIEPDDGNNFGTFPCFGSGDRTAAMPLVALSLQESVHLSIERWRKTEAFRVAQDLNMRDAQIAVGEQEARDGVKAPIGREAWRERVCKNV